MCKTEKCIQNKGLNSKKAVNFDNRTLIIYQFKSNNYIPHMDKRLEFISRYSKINHICTEGEVIHDSR